MLRIVECSYGYHGYGSNEIRSLLYLFMGPGHSQNFGNGLWVESVVIVSRTVSHCTGSCRRTYVEYIVGMSVHQQDRNSENLIIQEM
jgi:hypothetical protein